MKRTIILAVVSTALAACGGSGSKSADPPSGGVGSMALVTPASSSDPNALSVIEASPVQFTPYDLASGFSYSYGFAIDDFDKDGKPDISFFDSWVYLRADIRPQGAAIGYVNWNSGSRETIVPSETFDFSPSPINNIYLFERHVPADIDGDGWDDIVGVSNSHDAVLAYINPHNRTSTWTRRILTDNTPGAVNLQVADINGDGLPDVVVSMRIQPQASYPSPRAGIAWLENTGSTSGQFVYHDIDTTSYFSDARTVQVGDIDKDGKPDVLVSDTISGKLAWYQQGAGGAWTRHEFENVYTAGAHYGKLVDLNGDGLLDIVMPTATGIVILTNGGGGQNWTAEQVVQFGSDWNGQVTEVAIGDVDGDGQKDIVFSVVQPTDINIDAGGLYWASKKNGAWHIYQIELGDSKGVGVQLVDYNNDGKLDVVFNREYQSNGVTLFINKGTPQS